MRRKGDIVKSICAKKMKSVYCTYTVSKIILMNVSMGPHQQQSPHPSSTAEAYEQLQVQHP